MNTIAYCWQCNDNTLAILIQSAHKHQSLEYKICSEKRRMWDSLRKQKHETEMKINTGMMWSSQQRNRLLTTTQPITTPDVRMEHVKLDTNTYLKLRPKYQLRRIPLIIQTVINDPLQHQANYQNILYFRKMRLRNCCQQRRWWYSQDYARNTRTTRTTQRRQIGHSDSLLPHAEHVTMCPQSSSTQSITASMHTRHRLLSNASVEPSVDELATEDITSDNHIISLHMNVILSQVF